MCLCQKETRLSWFALNEGGMPEMNLCLSNGIKPNNGINYFVINLLTVGIFTSGVSVNGSGGPKTSSYQLKKM